MPFLVLAAFYTIATIDIRRHDGRVLRSVMLDQIDVGGMTSEELETEVTRAIDAGLDVATHAIGDGAVGRALETELGVAGERPALS